MPNFKAFRDVSWVLPLILPREGSRSLRSRPRSPRMWFPSLSSQPITSCARPGPFAQLFSKVDIRTVFNSCPLKIVVYSRILGCLRPRGPSDGGSTALLVSLSYSVPLRPELPCRLDAGVPAPSPSLALGTWGTRSVPSTSASWPRSGQVSRGLAVIVMGMMIFLCTHIPFIFWPWSCSSWSYWSCSYSAPSDSPLACAWWRTTTTTWNSTLSLLPRRSGAFGFCFSLIKHFSPQFS